MHEEKVFESLFCPASPDYTPLFQREEGKMLFLEDSVFENEVSFSFSFGHSVSWAEIRARGL